VRDGRWGDGGAGSSNWDSGDDGRYGDSERERDNTRGRVTLDTTTEGPILSFICHPSDRDSLIEGLLVMGEALLTTAVTELVSSIDGLPPLSPPQGRPTTTRHPNPHPCISILAKNPSLPSPANPATCPSIPRPDGANRMCGASWESWDSIGVGISPDAKLWMWRGCRRGDCMG